MVEHRRRGHGEPDASRLRQLVQGHVRRRFPGRLDEASAERVVARVMACAHRTSGWQVRGELSPALKAKINWAVLEVLWPHRGRGESGQEYDDLFAQAMFGDVFDVLVVQIVLSAVADSQARLGYALLCSLTLPVFAFALGWVAIGIVWGGKDAKVDRTPIMGAAVCLAPVLISCMGVGLKSLIN